MCKINESLRTDVSDIKEFHKYLVFYGPDENDVGIKGVRSDAPECAKEAFIKWYRENNRYENGRLRPLSESMRRKLIINVDC